MRPQSRRIPPARKRPRSATKPSGRRSNRCSTPSVPTTTSSGTTPRFYGGRRSRTSPVTTGSRRARSWITSGRHQPGRLEGSPNGPLMERHGRESGTRSKIERAAYARASAGQRPRSNMPRGNKSVAAPDARFRGWFLWNHAPGAAAAVGPDHRLNAADHLARVRYAAEASPSKGTGRAKRNAKLFPRPPGRRLSPPRDAEVQGRNGPAGETRFPGGGIIWLVPHVTVEPVSESHGRTRTPAVDPPRDRGP